MLDEEKKSALIGIMSKPDDGDEEVISSSGAQESAASDMMSAIESGDSAKFSSALRDFIELMND